MSMGIGAMLHHLGGGSAESAEKYYGRKITQALFGNDMLMLSFEDGTLIRITDEGQSCCESRYMTCNDNVEDLVGQTLKHIIVKDNGEDANQDEYNCHDVCFLEIQGDKGSITFCTHNEHNGSYGGFGLNIEEGKWK